ncbi:NAD(P)/FAD-dependent oxidoreductase [Cellulomonas sp. 179-A 9B4 NHS]|uniref:NAD(P)/FAD-dependent oxidoreductase n=1 Tax=Cellulomonas sp. 179-A 9B4 NHS TaxID=3142379 RepID=UPI0039A041C5
MHDHDARTTTDALRRVLWWDLLLADDPAAATPRPPLDGDTTADVVVVGGGLTGLWTAYYLLEADPALDVLVVEAGRLGAGAAGLATGTATAGTADAAAAVAFDHGDRAARDLSAALRDAVVEVGGVVAAEEVDVRFAYGGLVRLARTGPAVGRLAAAVADAARRGDDLQLLDPVAAVDRVRADGVLAAAWTPDAAHVDPLRLVRGLAHVVEARGGRVAERTRALRVAPRAVVTAQGTVRARQVVLTGGALAVAGSPTAVVRRRTQVLATDPLPPRAWAALALRAGTTVVEDRHRPLTLVRTSDDRLVAAGPEDVLERVPALLPDLGPHAVRHVWDAPVTVARGGRRTVGADASAGLAWSAGGDRDTHEGAAVTNLAGRVLADLLVGADSPLVRLPWVAGAVGGRTRPGRGAVRGTVPAVRDAVHDTVHDALLGPVRDAAAVWADRVEERRGRTSAAAGRLLAGPGGA